MPRKRHALWAMFAIAAAFLPIPLRAQFVYVTGCCDANSAGSILGYSVDSSGTLSSVSTLQLTSAPSAIAVDTTGKFLFIGSVSHPSGAASISAYSIGSTGTLTPIGSPQAVSEILTLIAVDPLGNFIYGIGSHSVFAYSIDSTGALTPVGAPQPTGALPESIAVDATGSFVYVVNVSDSTISGYNIGPTGALSSTGTPLTVANAVAIAADPSGGFMYIASKVPGPPPAVTFGQGDIAVYRIGSSGELTADGAPVPNIVGLPVSLVVDPVGKSIYATGDSTKGTSFLGFVSNYSITTAGSPVSIAAPAVQLFGGIGFGSAAVESGGKFFFAATNVPGFGGAVSSYSIGSQGALTMIGSPLPTNTSTATGLTVTPACKTAPTITDVTAAPSVLWPPNGKMTNVAVNYNAAGQCGTTACSLSIASNEPVTGPGPDMTVVDAHDVELRAARLGNGTGRVYTITIACTDTAGNSAQQNATVFVPHNQ